MDTIFIYYKIKGEKSTYPDVYKLDIPTGKDVYLLDILLAWRSSPVLDTNYIFQACTRTSTITLESPASVVPVINNVISLILIPSVGPPQYPVSSSVEVVNQSRLIISASDSDSRRITKPTRTTPQPNIDFNKSSISNTENDSKDLKPNRTPQFEHNSHEKQGLDSNLVRGEEAVTAIKAVAGEAGRHLLNFAAKSIKTAQSAAQSLTGHIQVGHHKVLIVKELAEGGYGKVFVVRDTTSKTEYAMKQLLCQSREQVEDAGNELKALLRFRNHPHIIQLIDHGSSLSKQFNGVREVLFLFPLYTFGTTWHAIENVGPDDPWPFPEWRALKVTMETAMALKIIHEQGFAHRDMKPHNVILNDENEAILMDLGSVTTARVTVRTRQEALTLEDIAASKTSAPYRAPELTQVPQDSVIDERVDVWGLGCTMYCLAFGRSPFETPQEGVSRLAILNGRYTLPVGNRNRNCVFSAGYIQLIQEMLTTDHSQRPFIPEVIQKLEMIVSAPDRS